MHADKTPSRNAYTRVHTLFRHLPIMTEKLAREFISFVYPPTCPGCDVFLTSENVDSFCPMCQKNLELIQDPYCPVCGIPFLAETPSPHLCGDCVKGIYHFDRAQAAGIHRGQLREVLHRFKYKGQIALVRPLTQLMTHMAEELVDCHGLELIVPVPLHPRRLRQRGFNQAALLAKRLASHLGLSVDYSSLKRCRWTEPQTGLSRNQRAINVKGAFELNNPGKVRGKNVLLQDDVFTTGETVNQCVRALKTGGAKKVVVLTVARTVPI